MKYLIVVDMQNDFITGSAGGSRRFLLRRGYTGEPFEYAFRYENVSGGGL